PSRSPVEELRTAPFQPTWRSPPDVSGRELVRVLHGSSDPGPAFRNPGQRRVGLTTTDTYPETGHRRLAQPSDAPANGRQLHAEPRRSLGQQRTNGRETNEYHVHCPLVTDFLSVVGFDCREQQLGGPTPGVTEQPQHRAALHNRSVVQQT